LPSSSVTSLLPSASIRDGEVSSEDKVINNKADTSDTMATFDDGSAMTEADNSTDDSIRSMDSIGTEEFWTDRYCPDELIWYSLGDAIED
jgi:hypothetical protein